MFRGVRKFCDRIMSCGEVVIISKVSLHREEQLVHFSCLVQEVIDFTYFRESFNGGFTV